MDERLKKEMYERREAYAARLHRENKEIGMEIGLSEDQCDTLEWLAGIRHKIHTYDTDRAYNIEAGDNSFIQSLFDTTYGGETIDEALDAVGLPLLPESAAECADRMSDYTSFEWDEIMTAEEKAAYEDEEAFREECLTKLEDLKDEINRAIESYLEEIDKKYKTHYAPTGATRLY